MMALSRATVSALLVVSIAIGLMLASVAASAQVFPARRVTLIVPYPPGGVTDLMSRIIAEELQRRWGQAVTVENKPGGGASVGAVALMKAPPDGHTIMLGININASYAVFTRNTTYDLENDVAPVTASFYAPYAIIASTQVPARTLREFIAYVKANPGKLNFASNPGSSQMLDTIDFLNKAGLNMPVVPYKGGAESLRAVVANEAQAYFGAVLGLDQLTRAGKIRALAVTSSKPFPPLPGVPTVKEATGIDFDTAPIYGYMTTVGTPAPIIAKLAADIGDVVMKSGVNAKIRDQGYEPLATSPEEWGAIIKSEIRRVREVAQKAGIRPE